MDDEMLTDLLAAAILKSACAQAQCRVSAELHKWFIYVVHLDDHAHTCPACHWVTDEGGVGYPRRFIPMTSLYDRERGALVADLSTWLTHLHSQDATASGGGGSGSAPLDGDAPTCAPGDCGSVGAASDGVGDGHRVGTVSSD